MLTLLKFMPGRKLPKIEENPEIDPKEVEAESEEAAADDEDQLDDFGEPPKTDHDDDQFGRLRH